MQTVPVLFFLLISKPLTMTTESILKADVLDIIFDNRNKLYGAYELHKNYFHRVKTALLLLFSGVLLFTLINLFADKKNVAIPFIVSDGYTLYEIFKEKKMPEPKPTSTATNLQNQTKFNSSMIMVQQNEATDSLQDISLLQIGSKNIINVVGNYIGDPPPPAIVENIVLPVQAPAIVENKLPVDNPDVQASYPGGEKELIRFLQKNLKNPDALDGEESVLVKVKFVVGFDGELKTFTVIKDGGLPFNQEVVRVLKKMPKWNPGKMGGQNVPVYYTIPVRFTASE